MTILLSQIVGGAANMRQYWNNFLQDTGILVYVVDSAAPDRFPEAAKELKALLKEELLEGVAIVVVANKQACNLNSSDRKYPLILVLSF